MHKLISDCYNITNDIKDIQNSRDAGDGKAKVFLYDFCKEGTLFTLEDIDCILCNRLTKHKDENKF